MKDLIKEATGLGLKQGMDFKGNISKVDLRAIVDAKKQVANDSTATKDSEPKFSMTNYIKVIITPRDSSELEGFVGLGKYKAQYRFDEEVEMPDMVVEFLRTKGGYTNNAKGDRKWLSRFIIEKV